MADSRTAHTAAVVAPNWLGDAVMCLPALGELSRRWPALRVYARPPVAAVFRAAELPLEVHAVPSPRGLGLQALAAMRRAGREHRPDVAVVLPNSFFSALAARALGARGRIGYARDGRSFLLTQPVPPPRAGETPPHEAFYYLELLRRAGLIKALPEAPAARLRADAHLVERWRERLNAEAGGGARRPVAIHAGASFGSAKRWLPERFAAVAARLAEQGEQVIFIGAPDERALAEQIRLAAAAAGPAAAIRNYAGETTLEELFAVLSLCGLLVANDSGPMHLAGALGTPVVAIFGPTNERETHPLTEAGRLQLVKVPDIECSPCKLRECPIDHRCMTRLSIESVLAAAQTLLQAQPDRLRP